MAVDTDFERSIYSHQEEQATGLGTLFETMADRNRARIDEVLAGNDGGNPINNLHRLILVELRRRDGVEKALDLGIFAARLKQDQRKVREAVMELRVKHGLQIGAQHDGTKGGYYLISSEDERLATILPMRNNALAQLRVVLAMSPKETAGTILGKLRTELELEQFDEAARKLRTELKQEQANG